MQKRVWAVLMGCVLLVACRDAQPEPTVAPSPQPANTPAAQVTRIPKVTRLMFATPDPSQNLAEADDKEDPTNPNNMTQAQLDEVFDALPKVGARAPEFSLRAMDGTTVTLSALRGHPIIINFWASWCVACRYEVPELQAVYAQFKSKGLVVLGINDAHADIQADAKKYIDEFGMTFPIPLDAEGAVETLYRVPGLPTSFFVDAQGVIRQVIMGQLRKSDLLQSVELIKTW